MQAEQACSKSAESENWMQHAEQQLKRVQLKGKIDVNLGWRARKECTDKSMRRFTESGTWPSLHSPLYDETIMPRKEASLWHLMHSYTRVEMTVTVKVYHPACPRAFFKVLLKRISDQNEGMNVNAMNMRRTRTHRQAQAPVQERATCMHTYTAHNQLAKLPNFESRSKPSLLLSLLNLTRCYQTQTEPLN